MTKETSQELRLQVNHLMEKRKTIENEIKEFEAILKNQGIGMTQSLVDLQGFPRSDVDVHQVLIARNGIIRLQNDFKAANSEIEQALLKYHAAVQEERRANQVEGGTTSSSLEPFAKVDSVATDSPAEEAGLQKDDKICKFGSVRKDNHDGLKAVGQLVVQNENKDVEVIVHRGIDQVVTLKVKPHKWSGRGLLGCHIIPL